MRVIAAKRQAPAGAQLKALSVARHSNSENFFPVDTGKEIARLRHEYNKAKAPISVSFRQLVHWLKVGERATHYLHPYPAKLLPHIAHFFLASKTLVDARDSVLDPFAGTGTVALETILSGRSALYSDANPLARLIASVKTRKIDEAAVNKAVKLVQTEFVRSRTRSIPHVVNIEKWFDNEAISKLARLRYAIGMLDESPIRDLMRVTFSYVVRKSSNADPRFSVPVRRREEEIVVAQDIWQLFVGQLKANQFRLKALHRCDEIGSASLVGCDARNLKRPRSTAAMADNSVGMILTSPPYAGAQKYVRATSLSLGWLDLASFENLRMLEEQTIGREHYRKSAIGGWIPSGVPAADKLLKLIDRTNPTRATIAATYLTEMQAALAEAVRVLRPGGAFVLVIGDNTVCGHRFASSEYLPHMLEQMGLKTVLKVIDPIRSRGLMTRRASTAGVISHETVVVLEKQF